MTATTLCELVRCDYGQSWPRFILSECSIFLFANVS